MKITLVPPEYCPVEWPVVSPMLEKAVLRASGRWTMDNLYEAICFGSHHLWLAYEDGKVQAAATTHITRYPNCQMLFIQFLGGKDFTEWGEEGFSTLKQFAKDSGCHGIECWGRHGWVKKIRQFGFKDTQRAYEHIF